LLDSLLQELSHKIYIKIDFVGYLEVRLMCQVTNHKHVQEAEGQDCR